MLFQYIFNIFICTWANSSTKLNFDCYRTITLWDWWIDRETDAVFFRAIELWVEDTPLYLKFFLIIGSCYLLILVWHFIIDKPKSKTCKFLNFLIKIIVLFITLIIHFVHFMACIMSMYNLLALFGVLQCASHVFKNDVDCGHDCDCKNCNNRLRRVLNSSFITWLKSYWNTNVIKLTIK